MRIYSMTATFGKLNHQSLTLTPGLNIIQAPNEWGKSTWCAFLVAMLYGINSREQTKTGFLADKEHYTPWSGAPMSGRMDLCWNGRDITIERRNKGRGYFNDFKAYETQTGIPVAELTAANCGQMLLGVEQSVFVRAGFLRQSDMPVTADEKLRARLNALVTTGDESGTSDALAQKLRDIKNRCRFNKTGLLPQAEAQRDELQKKLEQIQALQERKRAIELRQQELEALCADLENHRTALVYRENYAYAQKVQEARQQQALAQENARRLRQECGDAMDAQTAQSRLDQLGALRDERDGLHQRARLMPPPPQQPEAPEPFRGMDPQIAVEQANTCYRVYAEDARKKYFGMPWLPVLMAAAGIALLFVRHIAAIAGGVLLLLGSVFWFCSVVADKKRREKTIRDLCAGFGSLRPEQWVAAAEQYAASRAEYARELEDYRQKTAELENAMEDVGTRIAEITGDSPVSEYESMLTHTLNLHRALETAVSREKELTQTVQTLENARQEAPAPSRPDTRQETMEQTLELLSGIQAEQAQLVSRMGQCQGQLDTLGQRELLESQLEQVRQRIGKLEAVYQAAVYGMQMQELAAQELQRRFAPRISQRAQEILCKLTEGKYNRLVLDADLQIRSGGVGEDTLRSNLWRSSGTADQLYLALRLAVAEELTPEAPLILDDALVRFDEKRMKAALELLREAAEEKQVILFTCQGREADWEKGNRQESL